MILKNREETGYRSDCLLKFDLIVTNPPYININDWYKLTNSIVLFEPQIALTDHCDGLSHYYNIIKNSPK